MRATENAGTAVLLVVGGLGRFRTAGCGLGTTAEPLELDALAVQREWVIHGDLPPR